MVQLHEEKELERDRERIEAIAAGVVQIDSRQDFEEKVLHDQSDRLMVIFWGGPWCRKCTALKPEFVKLTAELSKVHGDNILCAYCDSKAIAKATDLPPSSILKNLAGVSIVPTLQCWRRGKVVEEFTSGKDKNEVMPAVRKMVSRQMI